MAIFVNKKEENYKKLGAKSIVIQPSEDELIFSEEILDKNTSYIDFERDNIPKEIDSHQDKEEIYDEDEINKKSESKLTLKKE